MSLWTKEFTIQDLKDGDYVIKVIAEDAAGNQLEASVRLKQDTCRPIIKVLGNPTELVPKRYAGNTDGAGHLRIKRYHHKWEEYSRNYLQHERKRNL